jgi:hypothetical protein
MINPVTAASWPTTALPISSRRPIKACRAVSGDPVPIGATVG